MINPVISFSLGIGMRNKLMDYAKELGFTVGELVRVMLFDYMMDKGLLFKKKTSSDSNEDEPFFDREDNQEIINPTEDQI